MKLLSAKQIQQWDAYTMQHEPITSIQLMERAATRCIEWLLQQTDCIQKPIKIFCGKGNNGGDGLAMARLLIEAGIHAEIFIIEQGNVGTSDFQTNLHQLHACSASLYFIQDESSFPPIAENDIVIDALFGSGLNRPLSGLYAALVKYINKHAFYVISIDIPSGMFIDASSLGNPIVKATHTLTFQCMKLCFLIADNEPYFGKVHVLDIQLDATFLNTIDTIFELQTLEEVKLLHQVRKAFSHKGTYGHALIVAGNKGKMGAAVLCAKACAKSGAGLTTAAIPENEFFILQTAIPEVMLTNRFQLTTSQLNTWNVIGVGPGLGTGTDAEQTLAFLLSSYKQPMVLDADALNLLSIHKSWLSALPAQSVLTPHPKEFDRLFGQHDSHFTRFYTAINITKQYPYIIVLKEHASLIACNGKGYINITGNAGMATGGSGDVLTGIITSLLAQHYNSLEAARLGVHVHGLAGDLCLETESVESLIASNIIQYLGKAFHLYDKNLC
jgi:NAD(P)H-hydrate epimerase